MVVICRSVSALKEAYGADAVTEAGLAILEQQFPAYSRPALKELLEAAGGDVSSALDSMSFLEAEHSNHRTASKPAKSQVLLYTLCVNALRLQLPGSSCHRVCNVPLTTYSRTQKQQPETWLARSWSTFPLQSCYLQMC